jgi:carboxypeptidase Taq
MTTYYPQLIAKLQELNDLQKAAAVLSWDRETNMPRAGAAVRTQQMTTLARLTHGMFTSDEMGELIGRAADELATADYDSTEASLMRVVQRQYADARCLPPDFVRRRSEVAGAAHEAWRYARQEDDFAHFQPHLETIMELVQEAAELYGYEDEKYDALLDKFERGMKTADVRAIFEAVKAETVPLIHAIAERLDAVDDSFLHRTFPIPQQQEMAPYMASAVGYDMSRGHIGTVTHPFATGFGKNDVRITTRWYENFLNAALFGTLHEAGHGLYEQNTHDEFARTPLARGTSSGIHESQSRMMENLVGRSRGFWQRHYGYVQGLFPQALGGVDVEQFYRAINKVQPSYIRVEADELTYNMHIILRFELEQALVNGELAVADLPTAWNDKMQTLLGVVPPTNREGCLQDMHWSSLLYGYFPTYALGNLYASLFMETAVAQQPAIATELAEGETQALVAWLTENIHQHGSKYDAAELTQRVTGGKLTHEPFVRYVRAKFGDIYGV